MRKIFLLLIMVLTIKGYGQTYTIEVESGKGTGCHGFDGGKINGDSKTIYTSSKTIGVTNKTLLNIPNYNSFDLSYISTCTPLGPNTLACKLDETFSRPASLLIQIGEMVISGCAGYLSIKSITPNVTIANSKSSDEICSGEELNLTAFPGVTPNKFPDEAYHWQYSFNGISNWIDVLASKNNTPQTTFSIQDILGDDHVNHFGPIYFRLGYDQNRPFTNPLVITYSSCAPVAGEVVYVGPDCNSDAVKSIEVYFDRNLKPNENLFPIYVLSKSAGSQQFFQPVTPVTSLTFDPIKGLYKYSFTGLDKLINGDSYVVMYQARMNTTPLGVLTSSSGGFTYNDPAKMAFKTTNQTQPSCFGGSDGSIEIEVLSGEAPYLFYKDGSIVTPAPVLENGKYYLRGLAAKAYEIKVTDKNGCIEKL